MTALSDELTNDPESLGYAVMIAANNVLGLEQLVNDKTKATINRETISRDDFLREVIPGIDNMLNADAAKQAKYNELLGLVKAASSIELTPVVVGLVNQMATDLSFDVSGILTRAGSRAEAVMGADAYASTLNIAKAVWGNQR